MKLIFSFSFFAISCKTNNYQLTKEINEKNQNTNSYKTTNNLLNQKYLSNFVPLLINNKILLGSTKVNWENIKLDKNNQINLNIFNSQYQDMIDNVFKVSFHNYNPYNKVNSQSKYMIHSGTISLFDYHLDDNGEVEKLYFATNAHVLNNFRKNCSDDSIFSNIVNDNQLLNDESSFITSQVQVSKVKFYPNKNQEVKEIFNFNPSDFRIVYLALDFLKSSPKDYIHNMDNIEEMIDFGILELDLKNLHNKSNLIFEYYKNENLVRCKKISFNEWLEKFINIEKINAISSDNDLKNQEFYSIGYHDKENELTFNNSNKLNHSEQFHFFKNYPGFVDILLNFRYIKHLNNFKYLNKSIFKANKFVNYGLGFVINDYQPYYGSSGSPVVNQNNQLLGLMFATYDVDFKNKASISCLLRSPELDYSENFGLYNIEPYDLIYGGYQNQKSSYKDAIRNLYGDNYKTWLIK
ncbi:DUF31 family protein [Mycoplasma sp. 2045]|uniref:MIP family Ig-specific serine endopeptidase n=1 Tax=Mycoplasma sp. 2045 TaxID=2967301 RepID=UPI00211C6767|nr:DUF31 family protein [Mycoplasma sp. 2045]UUM20584.1 DUF31 family protein [Mycoplasma sp. 2045]